VEKNQIHIERALGRRKRWSGTEKIPRVLRGASAPSIGWKPETRTCPIKTASAVSKTLETARKMIINGFWRRPNRIYICVAHGQVLKNKKIYIWLEPFES
jgi:hypothetical protein